MPGIRLNYANRDRRPTTGGALLGGTLLLAALLPVHSPRAATSTELVDAPPTLATELLTSYETITTLACDIRKTTKVDNASGTLLSRVFYERPDRIHVENSAPLRRRIVSDGTTLYYHEAGAPLGYAAPVLELPPSWLATLRNIPATPVEHLLHLRGIAEHALPPEGEWTRRAGYAVNNMFVVLACDAQGRLRQITFHASETMEPPHATYTYDQFIEAPAGCWIPRLHKAWLRLPDGRRVEETRRISSLKVNEPIAAAIFNPELHFEGVSFSREMNSP